MMSTVEEEQKIIKQYQPLIRALVPYEQQNKLLEGLNKFSNRLPSKIRKIVRDEVVRLTSLTDAPADNSAFAQFPVMKFKHFGISMRLDKVGAQILKDETAIYQNRYTVGVFESVMNSDHYQSQIKKEQFRKIVDAFKIECQSFSDLDFADDTAIAPNFTVSSVDFEKGRNCSISSLGFRSMLVETKRPPLNSSGDVIDFVLPEIKGLSAKPTTVRFTLGPVKFNQDSNKYESHFTLHPDNDPKVAVALEKYIRANVYKQPLQRDLEVERAMQDLERDRILENSPWLPVFLRTSRNGVIPYTALLTKTNSTHNSVSALFGVLGSKKNYALILNELNTYREVFVLSGQIKTKRGMVDVIATHRMLVEEEQLSAYIYLLNKTETLRCWHLRACHVGLEEKAKAFSIHDASTSMFPDVEKISQVVFCRDISKHLQKLTLSQRCEFKPIPKHFVKDDDMRIINSVMEDELDRRSETRYLVDLPASVKLGVLSSLQARIVDLSCCGLKLTLPPKKHKIEQFVRVSIPEFKIKNLRYRVVNYDAESGILRLCTKKDPSDQRVETQVSTLVNEDPAYFKMRDIARKQRLIHRILWELSVRNLPSLSVLCVNNRFLLDRLKTVYQSDSSDDLYPFSRTQSVIPLHGFFADKNATKPKSRILETLLKGHGNNLLTVHCLRKSDDRLVFIPERDFLYSTLRSQLQRKLDNEEVQLCASDIFAQRCSEATTPLTKKRLAQLSKLDKNAYQKLLSMQDGYTHCLFVTNISALQHDLVRSSLKGKAKRKPDEAQPSS